MRKAIILLVFLAVISEAGRYLNFVKPDGSIDGQSLNKAIRDLYDLYQPIKHKLFDTTPTTDDIKEREIVTYDDDTDRVLYAKINGEIYGVKLFTDYETVDFESIDVADITISNSLYMEDDTDMRVYRIEVASRTLGRLWMHDYASVTSIGAPETYYVITGTTVLCGATGHFDMPQDARIRYVGTSTITVTVDFDAYFTAAANAKIYEVGLFLNGSEFGQGAESEAATSIQNQTHTVSYNATLQMTTGDYLEPVIKNKTDTTDVNVKNYCLTVAD